MLFLLRSTFPTRPLLQSASFRKVHMGTSPVISCFFALKNENVEHFWCLDALSSVRLSLLTAAHVLRATGPEPDVHSFSLSLLSACSCFLPICLSVHPKALYSTFSTYFLFIPSFMWNRFFSISVFPVHGWSHLPLP